MYVHVAELTPTWRQIRLWLTWLGNARGNCPAIGCCSPSDWAGGASHSERRVTLAGVKPALALAAPPPPPLPPTDTHSPLLLISNAMILSRYWVYTVRAQPHCTLHTKPEQGEELLQIKVLILILLALYRQKRFNSVKQHHVTSQCDPWLWCVLTFFFFW